MTDFRDRTFWAREQGRIEIYKLLTESTFTEMAGSFVRIDPARKAIAKEELARLLQESRCWRVADAYRRSRKLHRLDCEAIEREVPLSQDDRVLR
jgi:hypothetical protein